MPDRHSLHQTQQRIKACSELQEGAVCQLLLLHVTLDIQQPWAFPGATKFRPSWSRLILRFCGVFRTL